MQEKQKKKNNNQEQQQMASKNKRKCSQRKNNKQQLLLEVKHQDNKNHKHHKIQRRYLLMNLDKELMLIMPLLLETLEIRFQKLSDISWLDALKIKFNINFTVRS